MADNHPSDCYCDLCLDFGAGDDDDYFRYVENNDYFNHDSLPAAGNDNNNSAAIVGRTNNVPPEELRMIPDPFLPYDDNNNDEEEFLRGPAGADVGVLDPVRLVSRGGRRGSNSTTPMGGGGPPDNPIGNGNSDDYEFQSIFSDPPTLITPSNAIGGVDPGNIVGGRGGDGERWREGSGYDPYRDKGKGPMGEEAPPPPPPPMTRQGGGDEGMGDGDRGYMDTGTGSGGDMPRFLGIGIRPVGYWPPPPIPFGCSCCQVIREIVHAKATSDQIVTRLEMHGRIGLILHALLEVHWQDGGSTQRQYEMLDFSEESYESVQAFMRKYLEHRTEAGCVMKQDPLSVFYETITVGLDFPSTVTAPVSASQPPPPPPPPPPDDWPQHPRRHPNYYPPGRPPPGQYRQPGHGEPSHRGGGGGPSPGEGGSQGSYPYRNTTPLGGAGGAVSNTVVPLLIGGLPQMPRTLAEKRRRVSEMTFEDFAQYFHLPIKDAADRLGLCDTTIKRKLREFKVKPWPHRKVTALSRQIQSISECVPNQPEKEKRRECRRRLKEFYKDLSVIYRRKIGPDVNTDSDDNNEGEGDRRNDGGGDNNNNRSGNDRANGGDDNGEQGRED